MTIASWLAALVAAVLDDLHRIAVARCVCCRRRYAGRRRSSRTPARRSSSTSRSRRRPRRSSRSASTATSTPTAKSATSAQIARYSDNHFVADGFYREFYPNGEKFVEGQYKNGRQDGNWTYWHDNGKVQRKVNYNNGQPDGSWEVLNAEGAVVAKRGYKDGKRDGTWVVYDETGKQPLREESLRDGKADGTWKVWFPTGKSTDANRHQGRHPRRPLCRVGRQRQQRGRAELTSTASSTAPPRSGPPTAKRKSSSIRRRQTDFRRGQIARSGRRRAARRANFRRLRHAIWLVDEFDSAVMHSVRRQIFTQSSHRSGRNRHRLSGPGKERMYRRVQSGPLLSAMSEPDSLAARFAS